MNLVNQNATDGDTARSQREVIWQEMRRRARRHGYVDDDLARFYRYLSVNLGLEEPAYTDSLQKPRNYFPGLSACAVHDPHAFAWQTDIVRDFGMIRRELLDYSSALTLETHPQNLTDRGKWSVLYFFDGDQQVESTRKACPKTSEIIDFIPGTGRAGNTYLSVLQPGTHIQRHFGPTNVRLRCHLGLIVPEGARIRIGSEIYRWQEGECLVFDDSFDHEVWNDSDSERIVLIIDFWHPELTTAERWAIDEARRLPGGLRDFSPDSSSRRAISGDATLAS